MQRGTAGTGLMFAYPRKFSRLSAPPSTVFEDFLLDTHTMGDLPAKRTNQSPRILDFPRMREQQRNRDHPSIRRSLEKERFSKDALMAKMQPQNRNNGLQAATNNSACAHL
jgi:hypothetical protein